jgi:hypothetical protein
MHFYSWNCKCFMHIMAEVLRKCMRVGARVSCLQREVPGDEVAARDIGAMHLFLPLSQLK